MKNNAKVNIKLHDVPGSVFAEKRNNKLVVQVRNKRVYTGLNDTPTNRRTAERIKENLYLESIGLKPNTTITRKNLKQLFDLFISEREITLAPRTITNDKLAYRQFIRKNIVAEPEFIEQCVKESLKTTKISDESKNIYLKTFQVFLNWLFANGHLEVRLNLKKKYFFKGTDKENEIFYENEILALLEYFDKKDREFAILINFLLHTGLRINEALTLTFKQVRTDRIILSNKVEKTAEVLIISQDIYNILNELRQPGKTKVFRWKYTSYSRLNRTLTTAMENLNIEKRGRSFHEFRKTFLYNLQLQNVPVQIAQKLMRHKNIQVTIKNYQLIEEQTLRDSIQKLVKK